MSSAVSGGAGQVSAFDARAMRAAIALAARGLGRVWPNPSVGALIVAGEGAERRIVGRGVTARPGGPHAEVSALRSAGEAARGATAYVTLEPCSHYGRTPPCSLALVEAGVRRVVVGCLDPNPRVSGRGIAILREAGVDVVAGVEEEAARWLHAGHNLRVTAMRPLVMLKLAVSADGGIGRHGEGQVAITGPEARAMVHGLRARYDAILVGIGTVLADDPELTCRLPGMGNRSPVRVVLDRQARLPLTSRMVRSAADVPVWVIAGHDADPERVEALTAAGVLVIRVPPCDAGIDPLVAVTALANRGITRLMVEGGAQVAASFLNAGLIDEAFIFTGRPSLGPGAILPFAGRPLAALTECPTYRLAGTAVHGPDRLTRLARKEI